ncbi:acyl-CoA dehydrogenase [Egibacter rhizosphaerae]|uniref:Broad-specificity linear acyl-CoA dehydrogenase FadE5 n=1 Tax=Egibacter rhizosphaerae TaxID=1670831 RepID=A0A411YJL7_9ACTN|nr:acyl-CoA dehydrogenase [Egibacter rhizosphaerae]QBI21391.1 acyl-CoA dehydrogenase [Egibacter rhizosphaerae]
MSHYRSNLRDIRFNLFEVLGTQRHYGEGPYAQMDTNTAHAILDEVERLARTEFAASFTEGDRTPLQLSEGEVTVPDGINRGLDAYFAGGWEGLTLPEHLGGFGAPKSLSWASQSMLLGANPAVFMYASGPFFASITDRICTDEQRERWVRPWVERQWGGTMVMTEPDAGSDVGAGRTKAVDNGDGTWSITGVKRFITNGDFDWPENIMHLVLARPEGHGPGTKGLSLFLVPKYWLNEDGNLGERNPVVATGLEDKMGLKASATCELTFDGARGVLVGDVHDGIRQMFEVVEYARMMVGTKAIETLSTGYLNALDYARQRVQGADLTQAADKTAPRVEIIRHPDVRRMLMQQKSHAEGLRALVLYTASIQDEIDRLEQAGDTGSEAHTAAVKRNDLLLPLLKGYGSEKSYELLSQSLQVLGGSGYIRDYPVEQYIRDAKIDTLYEGTTGIQGQDLFFRKIGKDQGQTLTALLTEIQEFAKGDAGNGALEAERARLVSALEDVQQTLGTMVGFLGHESGRGVYLVGLTTTPFLFSLAELVIGWLHLRHAETALAALESGQADDRDRAFYEGKVSSARWFVREVLPQLAARREVAAHADLDVMDLADEAL